MQSHSLNLHSEKIVRRFSSMLFLLAAVCALLVLVLPVSLMLFLSLSFSFIFLILVLIGALFPHPHRGIISSRSREKIPLHICRVLFDRENGADRFGVRLERSSIRPDDLRDRDYRVDPRAPVVRGDISDFFRVST